jgi:predicted dehydrogenase
MIRTVLVRGTGSIGAQHLQVLRDLADVRPVAWPVRSERAAALATTGYDVVAGDTPPRPTALAGAILATDTGRHASDGLALLENGWDLLVEKPLAADADTAFQLTGQARRLHRHLHVAAPLRFTTALQTFRDQLPTIGPVHAVRIACQSYLPDWRPDRDYRHSYAARPDEGGVLRDLIHEIDYAGWLFGWPQSLFALLQDGKRLGIDSEACADLLWTTSAGTAVSLRLDYLTRQPYRQLLANGRDGDLAWDALAQTVTCWRPGQPPETRHFPENRHTILTAQTRAFLDTVAGRPSAILATANDALQALAVCDAARRSALTGRAMAVELPGL